MIADAGRFTPARRRAIGGHSGLVLAIAALVLVSSACTSRNTQGSAATSKVIDLSSVSELQDRFNADAGAVRLILLMSPT